MIHYTIMDWMLMRLVSDTQMPDMNALSSSDEMSDRIPNCDIQDLRRE